MVLLSGLGGRRELLSRGGRDGNGVLVRDGLLCPAVFDVEEGVRSPSLIASAFSAVFTTDMSFILTSVAFSSVASFLALVSICLFLSASSATSCGSFDPCLKA